MLKKSELKNQLTDSQKARLLNHFDSIYECPELGEHEYNIVYLAWMWANGYIHEDEFGSMFDDSLTDVDLDDYEITFEDGEGGGMNLNLFYDFYQLDEIIKMMKWSD
jgi:hypothetical protein